MRESSTGCWLTLSLMLTTWSCQMVICYARKALNNHWIDQSYSNIIISLSIYYHVQFNCVLFSNSISNNVKYSDTNFYVGNSSNLGGKSKTSRDVNKSCSFSNSFLDNDGVRLIVGECVSWRGYSAGYEVWSQL